MSSVPTIFYKPKESRKQKADRKNGKTVLTGNQATIEMMDIALIKKGEEESENKTQ